MRRVSALLLVALVAAFFLFSSSPALAASYRNHIARTPEVPTSSQGARVWMESDTAFGETAGLEYHIVGTGDYVRVLGTYDTGGPAPANWRAEIPAQPAGTEVEYQLFTRNEFGQDYGFTGFNWRYTVHDGDVQWDGLRHDSFDGYYRSPFGAVPAGSEVTLRFRTLPLDVDGVSVRVYQYDPATNSTGGPVDYPMAYLEDRVEGGTTYAMWTHTVATPSTPAILYYKFRVTDRHDQDWYSDAYADPHDNLGQGGAGAASDDEPFPSYQITVYDPLFETPGWLQNANVYQIFPDRFRNGDPTNDYCRDGSTSGCPVFYGSEEVIARPTWNEAIYDPRQGGEYENAFGNQFFGGDLLGIEQQLDYLQGLGIDTLYLTPIFAGRSNHRYDTDDYLTVDPALGGDAAFESLVRQMEQRGMRLILDGVFNHTSSDSRYFDRYSRYVGDDGACESLGSEYRNWYLFYNTDTPCGSGDYEGWFGYESLAVLEDGSSEVRDFFYRAPGTSVVEQWYARGTSGWRFDVADEITHDWWREFRPYAKQDQSDGPLVGEVWYDATQFLLGDQLDSVMNYRFRKNILGFARGTDDWGDNDNNGSNRIVPLSPSQFDHALRAVREDYPAAASAAMLNLIDSHDTNRALYVLTLLGDNGLVEAKERLALTALFQFTYLGAPTVYYGDEAALDSPSLANGPNGPEDDPYNRAPYPWADESGDPEIYGPADGGMIAQYSALAHLRKEHPALRTGAVATLLTGDTTASPTDNSTYAFARVGDEVAVVALNNGAATNSAAIPVGAYFAEGATLQDALDGATYTVYGSAVEVTLPPRSGVVLFAAPTAADTTPPTATTSVTPPANESGWHNNAPVTVTLNASDGESGVESLRYWVDQGEVVIVEGDLATTAVTVEGATMVSLRALDRAGNISPLALAVVQIDSLPPTTVATVVSDANVATISLDPSDALSGVETTTYTLNGGPEQGYSGQFTIAGAGLYTVHFWSADRAGNQEVAQSVTFELTPPPNQGVGPVLECVEPLGGGQYRAYFGYRNLNAMAVTISVGPDNRFGPGAYDRGQPTRFEPGRVTSAFAVDFNGARMGWSLRGPDGVARVAIASSSSRRCR